MAAPAKGKKVVKRRRERKNIEKGAVHISSSFNNTMVTITDTVGECPLLGVGRRHGLQRKPEVHPVRCADSG